MFHLNEPNTKMSVAGQLRIIRQVAGNCTWSYSKGQFIATHGRIGMKMTIPPGTPAHLLRTKAMAVQKELIAVKKGEADEKTTKVWGREADKHMAAQLIASDVESDRKRKQVRADST